MDLNDALAVAITILIGLAVTAIWRSLARFGRAVLAYLSALSRLPVTVELLRDEVRLGLEQYANDHRHLEKRVTALEKNRHRR